MNSEQNQYTELDELLRSSYAPLRQSNPTQRAAVLEQFSIVPPGAPLQSRNRLAAWSISVLACAALIVVAFSMRTGPSAGAAYALDDIPKRLVEVKTIVLRGWSYVYDDSIEHKPPTRVPFEMLVKRPGKVRQSGLSALHHKDHVEMIRSLHLCDGRREAHLNEDGSLKSSRVLNPIDVRLHVEQRAQFAVRGFLLDPSDATYQKIGAETIDGVRCDIWELRIPDEFSTAIKKLWIDPASGMPVRCVSDLVKKDGTTERQMDLTEIRFNVSLDDELFEINVPESARATEKPPAGNDTAIPLMRATSEMGNPRPYSSLSMWGAFRVADNATLLIWSRTTPPNAADGTPDWLSDVTLAVTEIGLKQNLRHKWIYRADATKRWNWSLITTPDGRPFGRRLTDIVLRTFNSRASNSLDPLVLEDAELQKVLTAAHRDLLPMGTNEITLANLRAQARELSEAKDGK